MHHRTLETWCDPEAAFATAAHVVREHFRHPRSSATPVECYGVIAHWQAGGVTAWANFQGPFTLHSVAAAALGIPGAKLRLLTPSESGGSFGTKAAVPDLARLLADEQLSSWARIALEAIPEPSALLSLLGTGALFAGLGRFRRRGRSSRMPAPRPRSLRRSERVGTVHKLFIID